MNEWVPRIGSVPYLNARPLLEGLEYPITELVPARLCEEFQKGGLDAALLSSIDVLSQSDASVVDGVAIGSQGAVHSVILAYSGELEAFSKIQLDPSSHTSNALLQIILSEFYGLKLDYVQIETLESIELPRILIGDPAIEYRKQKVSSEIKFLDLGEEWYRYTGLSFVFALWIVRDEFMQKKSLADALRFAKSRGVSRFPAIAAQTPDPVFALRYFTEWISYDLGDAEKRGLALFKKLLIKHHLISARETWANFI